jgi:hypothetical protein
MSTIIQQNILFPIPAKIVVKNGQVIEVGQNVVVIKLSLIQYIFIALLSNCDFYEGLGVRMRRKSLFQVAYIHYMTVHLQA